MALLGCSRHCSVMLSSFSWVHEGHKTFFDAIAAVVVVAVPVVVLTLLLQGCSRLRPHPPVVSALIGSFNITPTGLEIKHDIDIQPESATHRHAVGKRLTL